MRDGNSGSWSPFSEPFKESTVPSPLNNQLTLWSEMLATLILFAISVSIAFVLHYFVNGPAVHGIPQATPSLPLAGSAPWYRRDPVEFLQTQRQKHGDIVLVNLGVLRVVFFLSPEGTNALLKGTEKSGISLPETVSYLFGDPFRKGMSTSLFPLLTESYGTSRWL